MPNVNTPSSATRYRGWFHDQLNGVIEAYYNSTAFLRASTSAVTLLLATTVNAALTTTATLTASALAVSDRGTATQGASKTTGVTVSNTAGTITTHNASLAAAAEATFTVTNTLVAATDIIVCSVVSGGTSGEYLAHVSAVAAGSFDITLANMSASSASDAVLINFVVIKAA